MTKKWTNTYKKENKLKQIFITYISQKDFYYQHLIIYKRKGTGVVGKSEAQNMKL